MVIAETLPEAPSPEFNTCIGTEPSANACNFARTLQPGTTCKNRRTPRGACARGLVNQFPPQGSDDVCNTGPRVGYRAHT